MPGKNKAPLLGWHPPAGLSAWVRAEAVRREVPLSVILNEAIDEYRQRREELRRKTEAIDEYRQRREELRRETGN